MIPVKPPIGLENLKGVSMGPETVVEPWMKGFMGQRHSQEEWDAFFYYVEAGPCKRWWLRTASRHSSILRQWRSV